MARPRIGDRRKESLTVRIDPAARAALERAAKAERTTLTRFVRALLEARAAELSRR